MIKRLDNPSVIKDRVQTISAFSSSASFPAIAAGLAIAASICPVVGAIIACAGVATLIRSVTAMIVTHQSSKQEENTDVANSKNNQQEVGEKVGVEKKEGKKQKAVEEPKEEVVEEK